MPPPFGREGNHWSNGLRRLTQYAARMIRGVALVVLLGVCLAACGGSGDSAKKTDAAEPAPIVGAAAPGISKPRYIARADRICLAARKQLVPLRAKTIAASKLADPAVVYRRYADLTGQAAGVYTGALGQIRGLGAPPGDQAEIDKLNMLFGQTASLTRGLSQAAADHDAAGIRQLSAQISTVADRYRSAAKAYGFRQCGTTTTAGQTLQRRGNR
jgi:hypothetical protein